MIDLIVFVSVFLIIPKNCPGCTRKIGQCVFACEEVSRRLDDSHA